MMFPERLIEALDSIYQASFLEHKPVHDGQCLMAILEEIFGKEHTEEILQRVSRESYPEKFWALMKLRCTE